MTGWQGMTLSEDGNVTYEGEISAWAFNREGRLRFWYTNLDQIRSDLWWALPVTWEVIPT